MAWAALTHAQPVPQPVPEPAQQPQTVPTATTEPTPVAAQLAETTRRSVRSTAHWLARGVDSWFGDTPFEQGGKVSDGRLSLGVFKRRDQPAEVDVRFNAHFELPNVRQNAYLFLGRDNPRQVVQDTPSAVQGQQRLLTGGVAERSVLAGIGLTLRDALDLRIGFGARLRPYVQARLGERWELTEHQAVALRETVFWTQADRFGATTTLSYEIAATPTLVGRWLNTATITQASKNWEWSSTVGAYQSLGAQRLLTLELLANGTGTRGNGEGASEWGVLLKWEQPLYKSWLLGEAVVGHFWTRPNAQSERMPAAAVGLGLKMRF
jgi:hypothetical protein